MDKTIIELLEEAKLSNNVILEKVKQIRSKIEEIWNHEKNLKRMRLKKYKIRLNWLRLKIDELKIEKD